MKTFSGTSTARRVRAFVGLLGLAAGSAIAQAQENAPAPELQPRSFLERELSRCEAEKSEPECQQLRAMVGITQLVIGGFGVLGQQIGEDSRPVPSASELHELRQRIGYFILQGAAAKCRKDAGREAGRSGCAVL